MLAWALAASISGLPSTAHALATGRDVFAATRAAGALMPGRDQRRGIVAGIAAHLSISAVWTAVFAVIASHRRVGAASGSVVGIGIAALDLGVIGRRLPAVASLPQLPQWADHALFGAVLGAVLRRDLDTWPGWNGSPTRGTFRSRRHQR